MELNNRVTDKRVAELITFRPSGSNDINSATREEWQSLAFEVQEYRKAGSVKQVNPDTFFVCGITDDGSECLRVSDDEAQLWTVYRQNPDGTSEALMDFHTRERAEATMAILARVGGAE